MASAKDNKASSAQAAVNGGQKFDMASFMPQGMDEKDLIAIGGLHPIASAEISSSGAPVAGWLIAELDMPERESIDPEKRKKGIKEPWSAFLVLLTAPTKAGVGEEIVDVPAGKKVIVPVGGNLGNNQDLRLAASDPKSAYWVFLNCTGSIPMSNGRSDMWNYEVKIHPAGRERVGEFRAPLPRQKANAQELPSGPPGSTQVLNRDGKPVESVVGGA